MSLQLVVQQVRERGALEYLVGRQVQGHKSSGRVPNLDVWREFCGKQQVASGRAQKNDDNTARYRGKTVALLVLRVVVCWRLNSTPHELNNLRAAPPGSTVCAVDKSIAPSLEIV